VSTERDEGQSDLVGDILSFLDDTRRGQTTLGMPVDLVRECLDGRSDQFRALRLRVVAGVGHHEHAAFELLGDPVCLDGRLREVRIELTLANGDIDDLPLPDDSADVAVANMVLHHAPDPAAMLAEMARIVRPGGTIAITDEIEHHYEWMRTEQADMWLGFTPEQIRGYFEKTRLVECGYASLGMQ